MEITQGADGVPNNSGYRAIAEATLAQLPADTSLGGELVVEEQGRLAFERLQQRLGAVTGQARGWGG
ncbi:hypothetical protein ACIP4Y_32185 [Streptomyces sp. NPDC088810]|uniref:hypothetical protein n=1 Tax=Streptomyces sp. NPDC088810 TaxID=3365904 RepID=UPI00380B0485